MDWYTIGKESCYVCVNFLVLFSEFNLVGLVSLEVCGYFILLKV